MVAPPLRARAASATRNRRWRVSGERPLEEVADARGVARPRQAQPHARARRRARASSRAACRGRRVVLSGALRAIGARGWTTCPQAFVKRSAIRRSATGLCDRRHSVALACTPNRVEALAAARAPRRARTARGSARPRPPAASAPAARRPRAGRAGSRSPRRGRGAARPGSRRCAGGRAAAARRARAPTRAPRRAPCTTAFDFGASDEVDRGLGEVVRALGQADVLDGVRGRDRDLERARVGVADVLAGEDHHPPRDEARVLAALEHRPPGRAARRRGRSRASP